MLAPPRLPLVGALLLLLAVALGAVPCESAALRLRGSVACLDCDEEHDLSGTYGTLVVSLSVSPHLLSLTSRSCLLFVCLVTGVVVAVKCAGDDDGGAGLHAAQTDGRGNFDVAVPAAASASGAPCAARVLGATEQLCAPWGLTVARVVPARAPGSASFPASYVLGSRLAFFTRCAAASGGSAVAATMADRDHQGGNAPMEPARRPTPPAAWTPPFRGGNRPPFGFGGLPPFFFFPFIPIIGIP